jgi:hypothetical protein
MVYSKAIDMDIALNDARSLYKATRDRELKAVIDRAELCWYKWRDDSDYRRLMETYADVMSHVSNCVVHVGFDEYNRPLFRVAD